MSVKQEAPLNTGMNARLFNKKVFIIATLCIITFVCFRYTLHNQFTNWDDDYYVTNDPYIKAFTAQNLHAIFTEDITKNNYHPLCMLSLAVNYHFSKLAPEAYYLTNILIHIANVILVFLLLLAICVRLKMDEGGKLFIAAFSSLWFGIHPMHVESVAWIAERKDVLYTFFYLCGLLTYLRYMERYEWKWYWATFILFIASCLSKPMAVVFPVSLLFIDILLHRQWSRKIITEKILFFAGSLVCGAMAYYTQNKVGAIAPFSLLPFSERIMYASYGYVMYVAKLFYPLHLSTFYPYPIHYIDGSLPGIYRAAPFLAIAIMTIPLYFTYKKNREYFRVVAFGLGFFTANVFLVLQFMSVGSAIMADRYSYLAYTGLFFMIAYFLWQLIKGFPPVKSVLMALLIVVSAGLALLCYQRTYAWHNAETLLSDAIEQYPYSATLSYKWLGNYYLDKGDADSALINYKMLDLLHAADAKVYDNMGDLYTRKKDYKSAITAFTKSIGVQNNVYKTYLDRSVVYSMTGDSVNALKDYVMAIRLNPSTEKVLAERGFDLVQNKDYDAALQQYNALLHIYSSNPFYYFYRGVAQFGKGHIDKAIADWTTSFNLNSPGVSPNAAYNLSVAYDSVGNDKQAVYYALMAQKMGFKVNNDFLNKLKAKIHK